uniref:protein-tyrosine-phosphatase n=1 Tax=Onchocerca volvulus TaxID=6282 RepID=A0A8R1TN53_ONCVO
MKDSISENIAAMPHGFSFLILYGSWKANLRLERTLEVRRTCDLAHKPENVRKNRFENVVIFDHCRIVLPVFGILFPYILAQDPLDEQTCYDFWCMIGEQNSRAVVMLSSESEFTPKSKLSTMQIYFNKSDLIHSMIEG